MSRHRDVRAINVDEEYEGYHSCYGHSVEDDFCISPATEAQFLYDRNARKHNMSAFFSTPELPEEENSEEEGRRDSIDSLNELNSVDAAKLQSCIEALQNVVGDTISDSILKNAAIAFNFDVEQALDAVLTDRVPKPRRIRSVKSDVPPLTEPCKETPSEKAAIRSSNAVESTNLDSKSNSSGSNVIHSKGTVTADDVLPAEARHQPSPRSFPRDNAANSANKPSNSEMTPNSKNSKLLKDVTKTYEEERLQGKLHINLAVIGHVDAGKSTLMGHLLYKLGEISKRTMHKFEQDSKKLGKSSFMYAWVLDETPEERNRGITMDVAQSKFETEHRAVTLLDAPGHKDFIPNMITAAAQADVAILVVDSTRGEFETGFEAGGQTREHTMLIRSLGVTQIAVAINKMDNVQWSQERYNNIVDKLSAFLKQTGFQDSDVVYVPCSGLSGENLVDCPQSAEFKNWYSGPTLVGVIDNFRPPERLIGKPLRMCISDVFKGLSGGFYVSGKIEAGFAKTGEKVLVMPAAEQATIKALTVNDVCHQLVFTGDHVVMQLAGIDINNIQCGNMVCEVNSPIKVVTRFQARIVVFGIRIPITNGFPVIIHYQSVSQQASIKKLVSQLHRSTGVVVKQNPRCLTKNSSAVVELETALPICIELYKDFKELGRFMLRSGGSTIAAGLVTEIL